MPCYDYECKECEHIWEITFPTIKLYIKAKKEGSIMCPKCGSFDVFHHISSTDAIYKAFGFYSKDKRYDEKKR